MFNIVLGLPWLVVVLNYLLPLPWPLAIKLLLGAILLIASQYLLFCRLSSGSVFSPEFPRSIIIAFNFLFGTMVLLAVFQLGLDVGSIPVSAVKGYIIAIPPELRYAIGLAAIGLSAIGVANALRVPPLKDVEIVIAGLPAAFDGYRLLQLTDLHISRLFTGKWAQAVVTKANALDADMIVMTGDLIDGDVDHRRNDVAPIAGLRARDGVFAIPGNHEYFFDYNEWMEHYERLNLKALLNSHTVVRRGEANLVIAGVTDLSARRNDEPAPDLSRAIAGAPKDAPIILLDHQPMKAANAAQAGVALQLSGHTHGGMILGLASIVARANSGFVSGLYRVGEMSLYVNNGTALWPGFALRLGVPSELTRITLRRKV